MSVIGYGVFVFAAAPNGGYTPGQILDPDCAPLETDCVVTLPIAWGLSGNAGTTAGTNFIGTTDAVDVVIKANGNEMARFYNSAGTKANSIALAGATANDEDMFVVGDQAGLNTTSVAASNFIGNQAGYGAIGANASNFFGINAGLGALTAYGSNFLGNEAGNNALYANNSNFFGTEAGKNTVSASSSNFFGSFSGYNTTASFSNFFGNYAGYESTNAAYSNFLGYDTGKFATNAAYSNFFGSNAGYGATGAYNANFIGREAGYGATGAYNANFIGQNAGYAATGSLYSNFLGFYSGYGATSARYSNFLGWNSGFQASNAIYSNFIGASAGYSATSAFNSNFIGPNAGGSAAGAHDSNFIGSNTGDGATGAYSSNFIGQAAGDSATSAYGSNFFGLGAGSSSTYGHYSNFIGVGAGYAAANAANSIFIGYHSGYADTVNNTISGTSILIGDNTGTGGFSNSIALGANAVNTMSDQFTVGSSYTHWNIAGVDYTWPTSQAASSGYVLTNDGTGMLSWSPASGGSSLPTQTGHNGEYLTTNGTSASWTTIAGGGILGIGTIDSQTRSANGASISGSNLILQTSNRVLPGLLIGETDSLGVTLGTGAGVGANTSRSVFIGVNAGNGASNASDTNAIGYLAGYQASEASGASFYGKWAGYQATFAVDSNFFGRSAGMFANEADHSVFMGATAGSSATTARYSVFVGSGSGQLATNAAQSVFIGFEPGYGATNAGGSIFLGIVAGKNAVNAAGSIFIGTQAGYNDTVNNSTGGKSILIGSATSTGGYSDSIALGSDAINTATNQFMIGSSARPIDTTVWKGSSSTTCTLTTGTGVACSSDERLKTNISDLTTDTLDKVLNLKTVTYNWIQNPDSPTQIGFLAQNLEQYFPELVATDSSGYKSVYYSQMTPILVEAIREMNLNVTELTNNDRPNTWRDSLVAWLGNTANGITDIYATVFHADRVQTKELCLDDVCVTKDQLQQMLQNNQIITTPSPVNVIPDPDPIVPDADPVVPTDPDPISDDTINTDQNSDSIPVITDTPNEQPSV